MFTSHLDLIEKVSHYQGSVVRRLKISSTIFQRGGGGVWITFQGGCGSRLQFTCLRKTSSRFIDIQFRYRLHLIS